MKSFMELRKMIAVSVVLLVVSSLGTWAVWQIPAYFGAGIVLLVAIAIVRIVFVRRTRSHTKTMIESVFDASYKSASVIPTLVISYQYGYPAFKVTFHSKLEMDAATTCNNSFKREIAKIFEGTGSQSRPFDADLALSFIYVGQFDGLRAQLRSRRYG
jgi:phosphoglycerol transferase MdoB-like AlkP superfamily enzyme